MQTSRGSWRRRNGANSTTRWPNAPAVSGRSSRWRTAWRAPWGRRCGWGSVPGCTCRVTLLTSATGREHLVPTAAVVTVSALGARVETARAARRFGLGYALRALSRDRATVAISLSGVGASAGAGVSAGPGAGPGSGVGFGWSAAGGSVLVGTIDAVGADHLDLAEHPEGVPRRRGNVTAMTTVPFQALVLVESRR